MGVGGRSVGGVGALLIAIMSLGLPTHAVPHYYINGYGCSFTAMPSEWSTHMKIGKQAVPGSVRVVNRSLHYTCPPEYGILLKMNASLADSNSTSDWISSPRCDNTFYRAPYADTPIQPHQLPIVTEYMCATHGRDVWYAGAFTVDRAFEVREAQPSTATLFAGSYSSDNYYRGMYYSAASIVVATFLAIAATRARPQSTMRKLGVGVHFALALVAAVYLWVAVLSIAMATPRPWPNRIVHASLGWFTLVVISAAVVLGALAFWGKVQKMVYKVVATLAVLLTIATSAVALTNFYDYDAGFVIGWAVLISVVVVYAALIPENKLPPEPPRPPASTVLRPDTSSGTYYAPVQGPGQRRSTRARSTFI